MKLKRWCLFLGMGLVVGGKAIAAQAENYSVGLIKVVQADFASENQDSSREAEIEKVDRLNQEGNELYKQGKYAEAISFFKRVLEIKKRLFGSNHLDVALGYNNLAIIYRTQGRYSEAESSYTQALLIFKQLKDEYNIAAVLNNLALLYDDQDRYKESESLYTEALSIIRQLSNKNDPLMATTLNNLGLLYSHQGRYKEAESLYTEALLMCRRLYSEHTALEASILNNMSVLYHFYEEYVKEEDILLEVVAIQRQLYSRDHPNVATTFDNLAGNYRVQGKYDKAEFFYTEALNIYKRLFLKEHPYIARSLNNLAGLYDSQGKYDKAEFFYTEALAIFKKLFKSSHSYTATAFFNVGALYMSQSKYPQALSYLTQAAEEEETIIEENLVVGSEKQKKQFMNLFFNNTNRYISFHFNDIPNNFKAAELAFTTILRRKGRVLDVMGQTLQTLRDNLDPVSERLFDDLANAQTQLTTLSYLPLPNDPTQRANIQKQQQELDTQIKQLEAQLSSRSAEFRQKTTPVTIEQVKQAIPSNAVLVEFIRYKPFDAKDNTYDETRYAVYVLLPNGQMQWQDLGEAAIIDAQIQQFRQLLSKPTINSQASEQQEELDRAGGLVSKPETNQNSNQKIKQTARELDKLLMQPVRAMSGDATHLLLSPDSQLNLLPFAALVDEDDNYLVQNYLITYLTSGRDLLRLQLNQDTETTTPLLFANPTYSEEGIVTANNSKEENRGKRSAELSSLTFAPLPATEIEGDAIKELIPQFELLTEQEASENNLKQTKNPEFLHLATHGFFLPPEPEEPNNNRNNGTLELNNQPTFSTRENPLLRSGLALAGFNQRNSGTEDGVLTALEVTGLNLRGTKLVVTSACETGLGDVRAGEGVYGLRRAFTLAGAQSQLMSLWKVSDEGTKDLMVDYYSRIQNGEARGEALRQVQLEMIQSEDRNHPFFWAAFIPSGSWLPLD